MVNQHYLRTTGSRGKDSLVMEVMSTSKKPILHQTTRAGNVVLRECKTKNMRPRNPRWKAMS